MYKVIIAVFAAAVIAIGVVWWVRTEEAAGEYARLHPVLYGNIDDRQVNLAFMIPERIVSVTVEEGDKVARGQLVGELETVRLKNAIAQATAAAEAARQNFAKIRNGSRVEDIDIAREVAAAAEASCRQAESDWKRQKTLENQAAVSIQTAEAAEAKYLMTRAGWNAAKRRYDKLVAGSRPEEIAEAEAVYRQRLADLAVLEQQLTDSKLYAPVDGIVRSRLLEPGEMASPQKALLAIAVADPKWVRTYVPESLLGLVKLGGRAEITVDSHPGRIFEGWVGFISPSAEFTPKNVETPELRTALVYETRVYVKDPAGELKLGTPATVRLDNRSGAEK